MTTIKTLTATNGTLFVTSAGQRVHLADFNGKVKIEEKRVLVPILGTTQKGMKRIYASFVVCGNIEYLQEINETTIHSGRVFEAAADVAGERIDFAGLRFEDSDPVKNELIFSVTDLELIQKLLTM